MKEPSGRSKKQIERVDDGRVETMIELEYEKKENMSAVRQLWQEAFHDPEPFAEYYFAEVVPKNEVLVAKESGELCSMLHLNPYQWNLGNGNRKGNSAPHSMTLHYIVGVATKKEYRRQGYMAACLTKALRDLADNGEPFTYLMPANPAYYEPFQFVMWKPEERLTWSEWKEKLHALVKMSEEPSVMKEATRSYVWYPERTKEYMMRLDKEMSCEQGGVISDEDGGYAAHVVEPSKDGHKVLILQMFLGANAFTEGIANALAEESAEVSAANETGNLEVDAVAEFADRIEEVLREKYGDVPIEIMSSQPMMLRVLNLEHFISLLPYKGETKHLVVRVQDEICQNNEGVVHIILSEQGCRIVTDDVETGGVETDDVEPGNVETEMAETWSIGRVTEYLLRETGLSDMVYLMEIV